MSDVKEQEVVEGELVEPEGGKDVEEFDKSKYFDESGRFKKGHPGGPGRPKGARNRFTALSDAFLDAFENMVIDGRVGPEALTAWAEENPEPFFRILSKLFPKRAIVQGDPDNPVEHRHLHELMPVPLSNYKLEDKNGG